MVGRALSETLQDLKTDSKAGKPEQDRRRRRGPASGAAYWSPYCCQEVRARESNIRDCVGDVVAEGEGFQRRFRPQRQAEDDRHDHKGNHPQTGV